MSDDNIKSDGTPKSEERELYRQKAEAQLAEWQAEIDKLKAKASEADADARLEVRERIDALQEQVEEGRSRLEELAESGEDAWESFKGGVESAWESLKKGFRDAQDEIGGK